MTTDFFRLGVAVFLGSYAMFYWWHAYRKGVNWREFRFRSFLTGVPDSQKSSGADLVLFGVILIAASFGCLFLPK